MAEPRLALPDALLRLCLLAALGMAALYLWQAWLLWPYPADWTAPPTRRAVTVVEGLSLFLFVPAAILVGRHWHTSRDRTLGTLLLALGGWAAVSFVLWDQATTLGTVRGLFVADAIMSLLAVPILLRVIRARA